MQRPEHGPSRSRWPNGWTRSWAVFALAMLGLPAVCAAQSPSLQLEQHRGGQLRVPLHKAQIVEMRVPIRRVSVGNPDIADILILRTRQLYVVGRDLGTTNVVLWDGNDRVITSLDVEVTHDLDSLKSKLHDLLPNESIAVHSAQRSLVLSGEVSSVVKLGAALDLARSFLPRAREGADPAKGADDSGASVLNLLQVGGAQQVMLEVKVAEMARNLMRRLDVDFHALGVGSNLRLGAVGASGASFPEVLFQPGDVRIPALARDRAQSGDLPLIGPMIREFLPGEQRIQDRGLFANFLSGGFLFQMVIDAAKDRGLAKILAEPTLTTLSGQEAKFISGGEFPIPVPGGVQGITIEFKEFGIGLQFVPLVLDSGRISLNVNVTVSELTAANSVAIGVEEAATTLFVPALTKRSAQSTVELANGQTLGIAGLINETLRENVDRFPGLGDIPLLGTLFRSQSFVKGQTELVIFVTPHFARPMAPDAVRLPTDDFVEPSDLEFYLEGRIEGRRPPGDDKARPGGGPEGRFGHQL